MSDVVNIAVFMLWIVVLGLLLTNAGGFTKILDSVGSNWTSTLKVLQMR